MDWKVMPISDCEVRDPRIRRTRNLLQDALRKLMEIRSFDEIAVQDIAEEATVNRATFYDHYTDKYALLEAMIAGGFHKLLAERQVQYQVGCPSAARAIILATCDYLEQSSAGRTECDRQSAFQPLIDAAIVTAIRRVILAGLAKIGAKSNIDVPEATVEIAVAAASWTIYGAVKEWFRNPGRPPAEEIVPVIVRMVGPILDAVPAAQLRQPVSTAAFNSSAAS
jgi:AcrR family transcriptional regulator